MTAADETTVDPMTAALQTIADQTSSYLWNIGHHDEMKAMVAALQSIADDVNRARYDNIDAGAVLDRFLPKLIEEIGEVRHELHCGHENVIDVLTLPEAIDIGGGREIVAWAVLAGGVTHAMIVSASDPQPRIDFSDTWRRSAVA